MENEINVFTHFIQRLTEYPAVKILAGLFIWLVSFCFGEFRSAYGIITALVIVDLALGLIYAWKNPELKIESRRLRKGGIKLLIYATCLIIAHFCSLIELLTFIQALIEAYIVVTELISVAEKIDNLAKLHGVDSPILRFIRTVLQGKMTELTQPGQEPRRRRGGVKHE